jgi:hypothetical protein
MMATAHQGYSDCAKIDRSRTNPLGVKGVGEIGIVGTAAIANAAFHATGMRVRDLPTPSKRFSGFGKALPGQGRRDGQMSTSGPSTTLQRRGAMSVCEPSSDISLASSGRRMIQSGHSNACAGLTSVAE